MSWSGEGSTLKSPLEQVWRQFVPQGHDAALRNAFYNVAAAGFAAVAGATAWHVYLIFQPFVRALLWAVLCGSVIHPVKTAVVDAVRVWLGSVAETNSSLTVATLLVPLRTLDAVSEVVGKYVVRHVRSVVMVTVVLPVVFIVIHYTPSVLTSVVCWTLSAAFSCGSFVMSLATCNKYVVVALVACYLATLVLYWEKEACRAWLNRLSVAVWLMAGASMAGWLFPTSATQIVFAVFCGMLLVGLAVEVVEYRKEEQQEGADKASLVQSVVKVLREDYDSPNKQGRGKATKMSGNDDLESVAEEDDESKDDTSDPSPPLHSPSPVSISSLRQSIGGVKPAADTTKGQTDHPAPLGAGPGGSPTAGTSPAVGSIPSITGRNSDASGSNIYIKGVVIACVLLELWRHHYLLALLPLAMVYYTIKKTTSVCLAGGSLGAALSSSLCRSWGDLEAWAIHRRNALFPPPLRGIKKVVCRSESYVAQFVAGSLDELVTCCLILAALLFIASGGIFLAVQIQGESVQLVGVASKVINATVVSNPQFIAMLPEGIGTTMNEAIDNAYYYGRGWLTKWVRDMVGEAEESKAVALEKQVLELWDRVYQAWVITPSPTTMGPVVTSQAVADTFDSLVQGITNSPGLVSWDALTKVIRDNVGTIMSVAESVWALLLSNVSLVVSLTTASASALLGGSLSLLNGVISAVVFLMALFYVLSSRGPTYKPVAILANLAPGQMNGVGTALEEAVNGVFAASLKMGLFYGLWTWLVHSLFATNMVYIPAVLGALFGAVPLVGTYWACVPGLLELWWGHGSPTLALLLLGCQLAPLSCVDTAIYAEIKGGGHPYLTGLAVGGGIYCWGAEGAILGPLLLCVLLVATNLYAVLIRPPLPQPAARFGRLRRNMAPVE